MLFSREALLFFCKFAQNQLENVKICNMNPDQPDFSLQI